MADGIRGLQRVLEGSRGFLRGLESSRGLERVLEGYNGGAVAHEQPAAQDAGASLMAQLLQGGPPPPPPQPVLSFRFF